MQERPTYKQILEYAERWKKDIPVRQLIDGKCQNVYLDALTPEQIGTWILMWYDAGILPHRVIGDKSDGKTQTT